MPDYLTAYCPASCKVKTKHIISADDKKITCRSCGNTRDDK